MNKKKYSKLKLDPRFSFTSIFDVTEEKLKDYGAVNISLLNDIPLFIDPFLLFSSEKEDYKYIHKEMLEYLIYVKNNILEGEMPPEELKKLLLFPEVKETWLGFSKCGNGGKGLGKDFGSELYNNIIEIFSNFGNEKITRSTHLEKLCLIGNYVGKDKISDFTTNFAKKYLLKYTEKFARYYISKDKCGIFNVDKVNFNYDKNLWEDETYYLPKYNGEYVLLTPKDILTRENTFINKDDMYKNYQDIIESLPNSVLKKKMNEYLLDVLIEEERSEKERKKLLNRMIKLYPEFIDYYIRLKENKVSDARIHNHQSIETTEVLYDDYVNQLISYLSSETNFYDIPGDTLNNCKLKMNHIKNYFEKYRQLNNTSVAKAMVLRESDLQLIIKFVWFGINSFNKNRSNNNLSLIENIKSIFENKIDFKLASNKKLKEYFERENKQDREKLISIFYYTSEEKYRLYNILSTIGFSKKIDVIIINASLSN